MLILGPVAIANNLVIGNNNQLPWHFPQDLRRFRELTWGKNVLMGRRTFESILARLEKPLPGRKNIVLSRQHKYYPAPGVLVFSDLDTALAELAPEPIYIIGGAEIFRLALPNCQFAYVTHIHNDYPGDAFFPEVNWDMWQKVTEERQENFSFVTYARNCNR